ncbi:sigma-70 family RNA polymerase sigma factor [Paenibacillus xylanexedens]|uniref:sigma-70 family RNA polymerase sigma factor n=1 Tax=Paenibacillus xylanexedens TaxID=528191 RepID=UPI000F5291B3|nr:sigma-70 family RNA polymerase sigma factor [Paenibacillus xylanexedens]RPK31733.1 hypothetical protein EDO6_02360 [Paenibacillus xylanexedens]
MNFDNMMRHYDPSFDNEAMIKLAKETNDKELRNQVINNNIRIVVKLAHKWKEFGFKDDLDDLVGIGSIGLVKAFDTYDTSKDTKLSTYIGNVVWMEFVKAERHKRMKCRNSFQTVSLETPIGKTSDGADKLISEILANDEHTKLNQVEEDEFNNQLKELLDTKLNEKERYVAKKFFFDGMGVTEIGEGINQTRQATHYQYKCAIKKLRPAFT